MLEGNAIRPTCAYFVLHASNAICHDVTEFVTLFQHIYVFMRLVYAAFIYRVIAKQLLLKNQNVWRVIPMNEAPTVGNSSLKKCRKLIDTC